MTQLAIPFDPKASYRPEDFVVSDCNRTAYDTVVLWPHWQDRVLWLCGPAASGKTHLLHVWAARAQAHLMEMHQLMENPVDNFAGQHALALDSHDEAPLPEEPLFHLINHVREEQKWLMIAHPHPPARVVCRLPDLQSRLNALALVRLQEPDDNLLMALIMKQFSDRQLAVEPDVVAYLAARTERSAQAIARLVANIDATALEHHKRITLPFVRQVLTGA